MRPAPISPILDAIRIQAHRGITTAAGDGLAPIRLSKDLLRRANVVLGKPLCSSEELAKRKAARAKLDDLRQKRKTGATPVDTQGSREQAPVGVYFEKNRNVRALERIVQLLDAKGVSYRRFDVAGDENTLQFVMRNANVEADDLPIVFVAERAIGGYEALVDADVSGRLERELFPGA